MCVNLLVEMVETCLGLGEESYRQVMAIALWPGCVAVLRQVSLVTMMHHVSYETSPTIIDGDGLDGRANASVDLCRLDTT